METTEYAEYTEVEKTRIGTNGGGVTRIALIFANWGEANHGVTESAEISTEWDRRMGKVFGDLVGVF
jgi:hypothetical protein